MFYYNGARMHTTSMLYCTMIACTVHGRLCMEMRQLHMVCRSFDKTLLRDLLFVSVVFLIFKVV